MNRNGVRGAYRPPGVVIVDIGSQNLMRARYSEVAEGTSSRNLQLSGSNVKKTSGLGLDHDVKMNLRDFRKVWMLVKRRLLRFKREFLTKDSPNSVIFGIFLLFFLFVSVIAIYVYSSRTLVSSNLNSSIKSIDNIQQNLARKSVSEPIQIQRIHKAAPFSPSTAPQTSSNDSLVSTSSTESIMWKDRVKKRLESKIKRANAIRNLLIDHSKKLFRHVSSHTGDNEVVEEKIEHIAIDIAVGDELFELRKDGVAVVTTCAGENEVSDAELVVSLKTMLEIESVDELILVLRDPILASELKEFRFDPRRKLLEQSLDKLATDFYTRFRILALNPSNGSDEYAPVSIEMAFNIGATFASRKSLVFVDCSRPIRSLPSIPTTQQQKSRIHGFSKALQTPAFGLADDFSLMRIPTLLFWTLGAFDDRLVSISISESLQHFHTRIQNTHLETPPEIHFISPSNSFMNDSDRPKRTETDAQKLPNLVQKLQNELVMSDSESFASTREYGRTVFHVERSINDSSMIVIASVLRSETESVLEARKKVLTHVLIETAFLPESLVKLMQADVLEVVMRELSKGRKLLIVRAMHGLGNRLRVLASAMAFAEASDRLLLLMWPKDHHMQALFSDLFEPLDQIVLLDSEPLDWDKALLLPQGTTFDILSNQSQLVVHNYMEVEMGSHKGRFIDDEKCCHIYFRSSSVMNTSSSLSNWRRENEWLRKLRPVKDILKLLQDARQSLNSPVGSGQADPVDSNETLANAIGIHIRMMPPDAEIEEVHDAVAEYGESGAQTIQQYREASRMEAFLPFLKHIVSSSSEKVQFYVASDWRLAPSALKKELPDVQIGWIPRHCDDRGADCLKIAMADVLALSQTKLLLGSAWSSYTELAHRYGGQKLLIAGSDFNSTFFPNNINSSNIPSNSKRRKHQTFSKPHSAPA